MRLYWLLAAILLITYGVYYSMRYIVSGRPLTSVGSETMDLSNVTMVANSEQLTTSWTNTEGSTLIVYLFPEIKDRTAVVGNEYADVVKIGSKQTLKILIAPDAGRSSMLAPAVLEIHTTDGSGPETVDINNLKLQRWNCIVIVKQGRKFNIYINGVISASHTCTAMPDFDSRPLRIGNARLGGKAALVSIAPYPMQLEEIRTLVKDTMQNDGTPFLSSDLPSLPEFSIEIPNFICPGGNCSSSNKVQSPMDQWSSSYA
jgi:hypothetical protein